MNAAPGWILGIGFFAGTVVFARRKQWRVALLCVAISVLAFSILIRDGSYAILLDTLSLSLILMPGLCLLTKRGQLVAEKHGLGGGTREFGIFLIILAIVGAVGIIMSALGY